MTQAIYENLPEIQNIHKATLDMSLEKATSGLPVPLHPGAVKYFQEQSVYNLRSRIIELEVLPCCRSLGLGVIPYSPMGGGLLCGVLNNPSSGRRGGDKTKRLIESYMPQLDFYERLCAALGQEPANVALAWVLSNSDITAPIIGPRTIEQLSQNLAALELIPMGPRQT